MTSHCIHGFPHEQCASCRTCQHGQAASACTRCRTAVTPRTQPPVSGDAHPTQPHAGFEIFYEPSLSGWRYRAPDAAPSALSYRSAFLARKAVDQLATAPATGRTPASPKAKRRT
jgi:hypothetical protein